MSKLGICTWNLGLSDIDDICKKIKEFGLDGMHFCENIKNYDAKEVKQTAKKYGLEIFAIDPFNCKPENPQNVTTNDAINFYKTMIDFAVEVDSPWVTLQGLSTWTVNCDSDLEAWQRLVTSVKELDIYAKEKNKKLVYEVCNTYEVPLINTVKQLIELLDEVGSDNIYIILDSFHIHAGEVDQLKAIRDCGDRLISYQVSDSNRAGIGSGAVNFLAHHRVLKEINFDNPVVLEIILPHLRPTQTPRNEEEWDGLKTEVLRSAEIWRCMDKHSIYK